ncbi:uncharacterized protein LOC121972719 [Zingiber officinale]|uniref:Uncharacterized protein n=1 Tax=Zingiber officinale TaxID=94328 RepID=A0A8J5LHD7_ZINOF|nr:uncharacterized protein LOC121972719 [Zingiber officinale]KAG6515312.1 hypothetical protein ZIOFF_025704 [Zingiber officinale]
MALWLWIAIVCAATAAAVSSAVANNNYGRRGALDPASTHYTVLEPREDSGQERFFCLARGRCRYRTIECPDECPHRKPRRNRRLKACFADCSSRCETTCRNRLPNCRGYGSVCYDPRFVGGDGQMFYFHGAKGGDFALVSDEHFQINAHFIGWRPAGRARDFTWVQALAVVFDTHWLVVAARHVSEWDDGVDALAVRWDGEEVLVPEEGDDEWRPRPPGSEEEAAEREVVVERTAERNSVKVTAAGVVEVDVKVVPITAEDDRKHSYRLPAGDAFAHLEMQFRFVRLTAAVEGVLGQTYRPGYVSPVKKGVAMPLMGGEDKYQLPSFLSTSCAKCLFHPAASSRAVDENPAVDVA